MWCWSVLGQVSCDDGGIHALIVFLLLHPGVAVVLSMSGYGNRERG